MLKIGGQRVPTATLLLVASDCLLIGLGLLLASAFRFTVVESGSLAEYLRGPGVLIRLVLVGVVCELAMYYSDLYNFSEVKRRSEVFVRLLQAVGISCLVLAFIYYIAPDMTMGRGVGLLAALLILILVLAWRMLLDAVGPYFLAGRQRVLIVGTGATGISLAQQLVSRPELNLKVVGFLDEAGENIGKSLVNPSIIGGVSEVDRIVREQDIDLVVLSLAERRGQTPVRQLLDLKFSGVPVEDAHTFYERMAGRIPLEYLSPSWLIFSDGFRKSAFTLNVKRALDVVASLAGLILTAPIMLLIASAIWLESGGPVLFRQERMGYRSRPFQMLKFRSMRTDAEDNGPQWAAENDQRITRVGSFIRKCRLDELPQLFNVLRGEMSLVGPRPERPCFFSLLEEQVPFFALRHSVRPGITGWAQIKYQYGSSVEDAKRKIEHDLFYIKHMSILLDLAILFETAKVMLYGRGAK